MLRLTSKCPKHYLSDAQMPVARRVARMVLRSASSSIRRGLLGLLRAGSDPLEAHIVQAEVLGVGSEYHASFGDVGVGIKFLSLGHDLALEARLQFTETTELDHIAVSDELSRHVGSQIEHGSDFHVVESGLIGDHFAEVVEGDATSVCGRSYLHDLPFELANAHFSFA